MKKLSILLLAFTMGTLYAQEDSVFELDGIQSMSITGQGPGQDAAINPYMNEDSIAVVENLGETVFSVRVKDKEGNVTITAIKPKDVKKLKLLVGSILYLDSEQKGKADVKFEKITDRF